MSVHISETSASLFRGRINTTSFEVKGRWKRTMRSSTYGKVSVEVRSAVKSGEASVEVSTIEEEITPVYGGFGSYIYNRVESPAAVYIGDEINRLGPFTKGWRGRKIIVFSYDGPQRVSG